MIGSIKLPEMRLQVVAALESLSDPLRQERWGRVEEAVNYFDDLTLNVNILYDDCMVLPDPQSAVPDILHPEEVSALINLEHALGPMIRELGDRPDEAYTSDARWPSVMEAASQSLAVMKRCDGEAST
jgi:hypothetical protein